MTTNLYKENRDNLQRLLVTQQKSALPREAARSFFSSFRDLNASSRCSCMCKIVQRITELECKDIFLNLNRENPRSQNCSIGESIPYAIEFLTCGGHFHYQSSQLRQSICQDVYNLRFVFLVYEIANKHFIYINAKNTYHVSNRCLILFNISPCVSEAHLSYRLLSFSQTFLSNGQKESIII